MVPRAVLIFEGGITNNRTEFDVHINMVHSSKGFKWNCRIKTSSNFWAKVYFAFPRSVKRPLGHIFAAQVTYNHLVATYVYL